MPYLCCDVIFAGWSDVYDHIKSTSLHTDCKRCRKGFNDMHSLQQHLRDSAEHSTQHRRGAAPVDPSSLDPPRFETLPTTDATTLSRTPSYDSIARTLIRPVIKKACALRFAAPSVEDLIHHSSTQLDVEVVNAILEGALRLLPADPSPEGRSIRKMAEAAKAARAAEAETAFVRNVRSYQLRLMDENEQKRAIRAAIDAGECHIVRATPDILFMEPAIISGTRCAWIEYKNTLGFGDNPFVHRKHKQQLQRYIGTFGGGMVNVNHVEGH